MGGIKDYKPPARTAGSGYDAIPATPLAARLRELRLLSGFPRQMDIAPHLETLPSRVSDWESGVHQPTLTILQRYARVFGMSVSSILAGVM